MNVFHNSTDSLASCEANLQSVSDDLHSAHMNLAKANNQLTTLSELQTRESEKVQEVQDSAKKATESLQRAATPTVNDRFPWVPILAGAVLCFGGILADDALQTGGVTTAAGCAGGGGLALGAIVW